MSAPLTHGPTLSVDDVGCTFGVIVSADNDGSCVVGLSMRVRVRFEVKVRGSFQLRLTVTDCRNRKPYI